MKQRLRLGLGADQQIMRDRNKGATKKVCAWKIEPSTLDHVLNMEVEGRLLSQSD